MSYEVISVVVDEASDYDLVSLAIVKSELGITGAGSDTQLKRYITASSRAIANHCRRVFPVETVEDTFTLSRRTDGEAALLLKRFPVVERVTTLTVGTTLIGTTELVAGTDYRCDLVTGTLYRLSTIDGRIIPWRCTQLVATYDAGYEDIPEDLQDAAIRLIRSRWDAKDRDPLVTRESIPGVRDVSYWVQTGSDAANFPPDVLDLIDGYKVLRAG